MSGYTLTRTFTRRIPTFNVMGTEYHISIDPFPEGLSYQELCDRLHMVIDGVIRELMYEEETGDLRWPDHDRVRLSLQSGNLHHDVYIPFVPPSELTAERLMLSVERVLQSNESWLIAEGLRVLFVHAPLPSGQGRSFLKMCTLDTETYLKTKRSLCPIRRDEHGMCFARALIVGMTYFSKNEKSSKKIRRQKSAL